MELLIYIRHMQYLNLQGQPIIYTGPNPQSLTAVAGTVPQTQWIDASRDIGNRDKLQLMWSLNRDESGTESAGLQVKRNATGSLLIEGATYQFIRNWCITHVAAPLNAVEVKIEDTSCGTYESYVITSRQIHWCENSVCEFDLTLKQPDPYLNCIQRTVISDNWRGWFQTQPAGGKQHPRFSYCNEIRPNSTLVIIWWLMGVVVGSTLTVMIPIVLAVNSIIFAINGVIIVINAIINAISSLFGGSNNVNPLGQPWQFIDLNDIINSYRQYYVESAGCGREHPAPLVRDYIKNVCDKCGIEVDELTAPVFFARNITIQTSHGLLTNEPNPHFNACYMTPRMARGIRRFLGINYFSGPSPNNSDFYIVDNAPIEALDEFLNKLITLYNAEWRIRNGRLYFWRKDWYLNSGYILDFTANSADRLKILEGVCFEPADVQYPAYATGIYSSDAADTAGNRAMSQMNGSCSFGNKDTNPLFDGKLDKTSPFFGATKFRFDGADTDYIYDAMQVVCNGQILSPWLIPQMKDVDDWMEKYANYALLLTDETCSLAKLLIWDGQSYLNARAVMDVVPVNNFLVPGDPVPQINQPYNVQFDGNNNPYYQDWITRHPVKNHVLGSALVPNGPAVGEYRVADYFNSLIAHAAARLVNYPMYFEPGYIGTLWDWFHWIDDPKGNPSLNWTWTVKIPLCCEDLKLLKVLNDASDIVLGDKVKLDTGFYTDGRILEIEVNYDSEAQYGKYIQLKGKV